MKFYEIESYVPVNDVDDSHVEEIMESMRKNGFVGCPILVDNLGRLVTGSHRLEALKRLAEEDDEVYDWEVAEDVSDIINEAFDAYIDEYGVYPDMDYSDIGWIFENSWVAEYKSEIAEW